MDSGNFAFDRFVLDPANRCLSRDGARIALNARYLDALALLVAAPGQLVSKDRFLAEVWRGVPVTDEALTQCIRTLRRALDDSASVPRFIETVPKHGYRFVAPVAQGGGSTTTNSAAARPDWSRLFRLGGAGTVGASLAGTIGGLSYGLAAASGPTPPATGAASLVLVLLCLTLMMAVVGGAGVAFGIAAADLTRGHRWRRIIGGALGGLIVGGGVKLVGLDAFTLLFGMAPAGIAGAGAGAVLGLGVGLGAWLADEVHSLRRRAATAAITGGLGGMFVAVAGGRLMGGSLDRLAQTFPEAHFRLDAIGALLGEDGFGFVSRVITSTLEGALFAGCIVGAMTWCEARNRVAIR